MGALAAGEGTEGAAGLGSGIALPHGTCTVSVSFSGTVGTGGSEAAAEDVAFHGWTTGSGSSSGSGAGVL